MPTHDKSSQHLASARQLLDELSSEPMDAQTRATAAVAHSILVLAEQVAVARVVMATDAAETMALQH